MEPSETHNGDGRNIFCQSQSLEVDGSAPASPECERGRSDFELPPLNSSDESALLALNLTTEDVNFFRDVFVGSPWTYAFLRHQDGEWVTCTDQFLTTRALIGHLAGRHWIGTGAKWEPRDRKFVASWFAIDLDLSDGWTSVYRRYDQVGAELALRVCSSGVVSRAVCTPITSLTPMGRFIRYALQMVGAGLSRGAPSTRRKRRIVIQLVPHVVPST